MRRVLSGGEVVEETLGIDVGGVIIDRVSDETDTSFFGDNHLRTPAVGDAFGTIRRLGEGRFGDRVYLVSKCGPAVQAKTLDWFAHHDFYRLTGIGPERVRFCRRRFEKASLCADLQITHFVDDRLEVLGYLVSVPNRFLFRPLQREVERFAEFLPHVHRVESWRDLEGKLLP